MSRDLAAFPPALISALTEPEIQRCFLAQLYNGYQTVYMTSWDTDLGSWLKTPGFEVSRLSIKNGGEPLGLDIRIPISEDGPIYAEDVRRGQWRGAIFYVWIYMFPLGTTALLAQGFVGKANFSDRLNGTFELITKADALKDVFLMTVQPACQFQFCGARCGLNEATFTRNATVTDVLSNRVFNVAFSSALDFNHGKFSFISGYNTGKSGFIRQFTPSTGLVEMASDFPGDVTIGDAGRMLAGCDHTREDCDNYGNIDRFSGFDYVAA